MPYIGTKTTLKISDEKKEIIKKKFGKAIEIFPGKTERWLMVSFDEGLTMYMAGDGSDDTAFVEVKLLGKGNKASFDKMTAEICSILTEELGIKGERIYVKYEECEYWGYDGINF